MTTLKSLLDLSASEINTQPSFDPAKVICKHLDKEVQQQYNWADFCKKRDAWRKTFIEQPDTHIALFSHSAFDFVCALSALWQCQKTAVIPGSNDDKTRILLQQHCDAIAGDFEHHSTLKAAESSSSLPTMCSSKIHQPASVAIVIFTSGSSGDPLPINKTFAQLDAELRILESLWGDRLGECTVTGTVSHQHIYGLMFRLLWPLMAGRTFSDRAHNYCESLLSACRHYGSLAAIMSPAHLSRLPQALNNSLMHKHCRAIFSSGAPLQPNAAHECRDILQQDAIEVYGSSETGGVAYRQQINNPLWQLLPGVSAKSQTTGSGSVLCIKSPHLDSDDWFISADQVKTLSADGFTLGKRIDRIAKIGGKRISLTDIEKKIQQHPWVSQVRVIVLDKRGGRSAALVVLNREGNNQLINFGKRHINAELSQSLESHIERIALPRYWRYWDSIPCNQQGKTTQAELESIFDDSNKPQFPDVLHIDNFENNQVITLYVRHNLSWFDGHFPGRPILPGVVQTHWANHFAQQIFGNMGAFSHLEVIKFQHVITPGNQLQLQLKWNPEKLKLSFSYQSESQKFSSGRIAFTHFESSVE